MTQSKHCRDRLLDRDESPEFQSHFCQLNGNGGTSACFLLLSPSATGRSPGTSGSSRGWKGELQGAPSGCIVPRCRCHSMKQSKLVSQQLISQHSHSRNNPVIHASVGGLITAWKAEASCHLPGSHLSTLLCWEPSFPHVRHRDTFRPSSGLGPGPKTCSTLLYAPWCMDSTGHMMFLVLSLDNTM